MVLIYISASVPCAVKADSMTVGLMACGAPAAPETTPTTAQTPAETPTQESTETLPPEPVEVYTQAPYIADVMGITAPECWEQSMV